MAIGRTFWRSLLVRLYGVALILSGLGSAFSAHVQFNFADFTAATGPLTNRVINVIPTNSTPRLNGNVIVTSDRRTFTNDANASLTISNMVASTYHCVIKGPWADTAFEIAVPDVTYLTNANRLLSYLCCQESNRAPVTFEFSDFVTDPLASRVLTIQPTNSTAPRACGELLITRDRITFTNDGSGVVTVPMVPAIYHCVIHGPFKETSFYVSVPATNIPLSASAIITVPTNAVIIPSNSTNPPGTVAYSMASADAIFVKKTNSWSSSQTLSNALFAGSTNAFRFISGSAGDILKTGDGTNWYASSGAGEANTSSNIGDGVGIAASKSGVDLPFKSFKSANAMATWSTNATNITLTIDLSNTTNIFALTSQLNSASNSLVTLTINATNTLYGNVSAELANKVDELGGVATNISARWYDGTFAKWTSIEGDNLGGMRVNTWDNGVRVSFDPDTGQMTLNNGFLSVSDATANRAAYYNASRNIVSSSVTDTELGYLSGVTSGLQAQIDGKIAIQSGAGNLTTLTQATIQTSITVSNITASRVAIFNGSKQLTNSAAVDTTELEYLDGVTSPIQQQFTNNFTFDSTQFARTGTGGTNIVIKSGASVTSLTVRTSLTANDTITFGTGDGTIDANGNIGTPGNIIASGLGKGSFTGITNTSGLNGRLVVYGSGGVHQSATSTDSDIIGKINIQSGNGNNNTLTNLTVETALNNHGTSTNTGAINNAAAVTNWSNVRVVGAVENQSTTTNTGAINTAGVSTNWNDAYMRTLVTIADNANGFNFGADTALAQTNSSGGTRWASFIPNLARRRCGFFINNFSGSISIFGENSTTSGTLTYESPTTNAWWTVVYTTAASVNADAGWGHSATASFFPGGNICYDWVGRINAVGTNQIRVWMGLTDTTIANMNGTDSPTTRNVAMVRYSQSASDANWQFVTCDASSCTVTPSNTAVSTNRTEFRMVEDISNTRWLLYINGLVAATNSANLPVAAMGSNFSIRSLNGTAYAIRHSSGMVSVGGGKGNPQGDFP